MLSVALLSGCFGVKVSERQSITIDGYGHTVVPMTTPNTYIAAGPNQYVGAVNPMNALNNLRAIEGVTGCHIVEGSVAHQPSLTTAMVTC
jgi:hypothetical protein